MESSPSGGDVKQAYDYDKERCDMADRLTASAELCELKESFAEFPPRPDQARVQDLQNVHPAEGHTQDTGTVFYRGTFQGCSHRQHLRSQIGTHTHQIPPGK
jgi:hypothetical protein